MAVNVGDKINACNGLAWRVGNTRNYHGTLGLVCYLEVRSLKRRISLGIGYCKLAVDLVEAESSSDRSVRKFNGLLALLVELDGPSPLFVEKVALGGLCLPEYVRAIGELDDGELSLSVGSERAYYLAWSDDLVVVDHISLGDVGYAHLGSLEGGVSLRTIRTQVDVHLHQGRCVGPFDSLVYGAGVARVLRPGNRGNAYPARVEFVALRSLDFSQLIGAVGKDVPACCRTVGIRYELKARDDFSNGIGGVTHAHGVIRDVAYLEACPRQGGVALCYALLELVVYLAHTYRPEKNLIVYAPTLHVLHGAGVVPSVEGLPDGSAILERDHGRVRGRVREHIALGCLGLCDAIGAQGEDRLSLRVGKELVAGNELGAAVGCHARLVRRKDPGSKRVARYISRGVSVVGDGELRPCQRAVALCCSSRLGVELLHDGAARRTCWYLLDGCAVHLRC